MLKLIDDKVSKRMEVLRFPLIVLIVFNHNYANSIRSPQGVVTSTDFGGVCVDFVKFLISLGIARVAVPLFFLMSGYLFFLGEWSWAKYSGKLKRRLRTLLIPYLFWNLLTLLVKAIAPTIPRLNAYFFGISLPPLHTFSFVECVNVLFKISMLYLVNPISFQFWFIRNLMGLVLLAPVIHFLLTRRSALPFLAVLFCWWFFSDGPVLWRMVEASLFFSSGAYFSLASKNVTYLDRFGPWISAMFACFLVLYTTFPNVSLLYKATLVFGVPSLWWLTKLATNTVTLKSWCVSLSGASFFVFAAHEPWLTSISKITYKVLSPTEWAATLALYFLVPICLVTLLVVLYRCLLWTVPSFLAVITGSSYRPHKLPQ
jgi:surface polysaccharide O-acyltransferase-like enzyme